MKDGTRLSTFNATAEIHESTIERYPEHAQAIGMISIEIGNLEIRLGELLGALLHIGRNFGRTLYLTPNANLARLGMIENVLAMSLVPDTRGYKMIARIIGDAKAVIGKRHEYVHNVWGLNVAAPTRVERRAVPFRDTDLAKPVPLNELRDQIQKIRRLSKRVRAEGHRIYAEWPPYSLPETMRARLLAAKEPSVRPLQDNAQE